MTVTDLIDCGWTGPVVNKCGVNEIGLLQLSSLTYKWRCIDNRIIYTNVRLMAQSGERRSLGSAPCPVGRARALAASCSLLQYLTSVPKFLDLGGKRHPKKNNFPLSLLIF